MVRQLVLMRHAQAANNAPTDFERPLTPRGVADADRVGEMLAQRYDGFDRIVASAARRTRSTAQAVASQCGYPRQAIDLRPEIYDAMPGLLLSVLQAQPDSAQRVLLVAHNPGISYLASLLTQEPGIALAPAEYVELDLDLTTWTELGSG